MPVLSSYWRAACVLCLLLIVFTACEYAPPPTSTPQPTATRQATETPTQSPATPTSAATAAATGDASVATEAANPAAAVKGHVSVSMTRVRDLPNIRGKQLIELKQDDEVVVLGRTADSGYLLVQTADGSVTGWTANQSIALDDPLADIPVATPAA